ncbi:ComEC/Rec2 family competence protein [Bacteriovorax sp. Seq25_V]|uniref:ComEC/Rec2 family competence protein n=1 Tax=Bacteriovorax sp. Seq25_V TaxID=1201288 RepID=UPI0003FEECF6|nr:ComEC/Rec2 family competence protein [Bacteriovorax sp. Seq25_V]
MAKSIFLFSIFLLLLSPLNYNKKNQKTYSLKLSLKKEKFKSFSSKDRAHLYQSFVLGNKYGLSPEKKDKLKVMGLYHLMTPSGLHYSCLLFLLIFLKRKYNNRYLSYLEILIGVAIHTFLPGFYAFKRVALLRSLKVSNDIFLDRKFSRLEILLCFLCFDILFGTFRFSNVSFLMSILFIGIFYLRGSSKFFIVFNLFIGQIIMAYIFGNEVSILNLILSPFYTMIFSFLYPLLCFNIFFLDIINYSEYILLFLEKLLEASYFLSKVTPYFQVTLPFVISAILINRKNFLFFFALSFLTFTN